MELKNIYDVVIIGGGPAGLSAAIYASRSKLSTLILEKEKTGGQIVTTEEVANVPGSIHGEDAMETSGPKLVARMVKQAEYFGAERLMKGVKDVDFTKDIKELTLNDDTVIKAKSVIIATGANSRKLEVPGEKELTGKGVSYCATCDADFFEDMEVFTIGGGFTAAEESIYLAKFAEKVTMVVRGNELKAARSIVEEVENHPKIEILFNTEVEELKGDGILESAVFKNNKTGEIFEHLADEDFGTFGLFVFAGYNPNTDLFKGHVELDEMGYIPTTDSMETNVPGVYAAGDLRPKVLRQVITATADGAIAATALEKYLKEFDQRNK